MTFLSLDGRNPISSMYIFKNQKSHNKLKQDEFSSVMTDYFCTVGYGLDQFAVREISNFPDVCVTEVITGKVFFSKGNISTELLSLKTIERLFVQVLHIKVDSRVTIDSAINWIEEEIKSKNISWIDILETWKHLTNHCFQIQLKFRVNARLTGKFRKVELYPKVSASIGTIVIQNFGAVSELSQPDLEIFVHLSEAYLTIGLPVTRRPISDRIYLKHIAVRSTVCCALCTVVSISQNDFVLDPMCGAATVLIEAIKQFNVKCAVGVDNNFAQLKLAQENQEQSNVYSELTLILGNSENHFLKREFFDVVICDVPFGRKFGASDKIKPLLKSVFNTIATVLKPKGRVAILISEDLRQFVINLCQTWTLTGEHPLRLGKLPACILSWCNSPNQHHGES